jgi:TldD protein
MSFSRRRFLSALGSTAGAAVVAPWFDAPFWPVQPAEAVTLSIGELKTLVDAALARARALGCSFAGILIERRLDASVSRRVSPEGLASASSASATRIPEVLVSERFRVGVRVVLAGVSGYAEGSSVDQGEIARLTERAVANARANSPHPPSTVPYEWIAPRLTDPSEVARKHRLAFRQAVGRAVRERGGAVDGGPSVTIRGEHSCYVSTRGNCTQMSRIWEA